MTNALTTVTICWTPVEAGLFRDALEAAGIRSFVRESNLGTIDPFVTPALGGIRLDVDTGHLERARAIVAEVRASLPAKKPADESPWIEDDDRCPACKAYLEEDSDDCTACGWTCGDAEPGLPPPPA